jgi:cytochrome c oxidase subunit 2
LGAQKTRLLQVIREPHVPLPAAGGLAVVSRRVRRGALLGLVAIGLAAAAVATAVAVFIGWLPEQASKEREGIDFVFWFTTAICIAIFSIVAGVSVYAGIKFRVRPDDDTDGPPIHGHTGLEIVWTAIPATLVTAIAIVSAVVLARNESAGKDPLIVNVTGQQFVWSFKYANGVVSPNLRLPIGRSTKLLLHAKDVIHSFWVPEFGQKQDAVPGLTTHLVITPTKLGTYRVICTELCGLGHGLMRTSAIVMPKDDFRAWLTRTKSRAGGGGAAAGKAIFNQQGCAACHTLKAAGATAKVGPDLDKLPVYARRAGQPLEDFIRTSIVNPTAYTEPGYTKGLMPPFSSLPKAQLDALVRFLISSSRGAG